MKEHIEHSAKTLMARPVEVEVHKIAGETTNAYELRTGDGDLGKIIGKHGRTIHWYHLQWRSGVETRRVVILR